MINHTESFEPSVEALIQNLEKHVKLDHSEKVRIKDVFHAKTYAKKSLLLAAGDACRYLNYVSSGTIKICSIDKEREEHVIFFAVEDWWAVDLKSFVTGDPARFFIEALENAEVLQINKEAFEKLLIEIPKLERWFRILLQNALISSENRIDYKLSLSAEERYEMFLQRYPKLESRIPQKQIASYLGITPEFLSKMKSKRIQNQKS